jgi:hypothetical protein
VVISGSVNYDTPTGFLSVISTGSLSSLIIGDGTTVSLPADFGFEAAVLLPVGRLPADFSSLATDRVFVGIENDQPGFDLVAGFLISEAGIAIANSTTSVQTILPESAAIVNAFRMSEGDPLILRAAFKTDSSFSPPVHTLSVAVALGARLVLSYEEPPFGSSIPDLPFTYSGSDDRLNIEVISPALSTREVLVGFLGLSTQLTTFAVTSQPNPGPDQVVELGEISRLDGRKSLSGEEIVFAGLDLKPTILEPIEDGSGVVIVRQGDTVAGVGFTDTFTVTSPATSAVAFTQTAPGDFIVIDGLTYVIATIAFPTVTVTEPSIPLGLTGVTWQTFSPTLVESVSTSLVGVVAGDTLRINNTDNVGTYAIQSLASGASPFRLRLQSPLRIVAFNMDFAIGPDLGPPTILNWVVSEKPSDSQLDDIEDFQREGDILRFMPDVVGTYRFELQVDSPSLDFVTSFVDIVVEVLEAKISPGEIPDASIIWSLISDFWSLIPDKQFMETSWSADMQVMADELMKLYQTDYNKSIIDIQRTFRRKWQKIDTLQAVTNPVLSSSIPDTQPNKASAADGFIFQDHIFETSIDLLVADVQPGDALTLNGVVVGVQEVLSANQLSFVGPSPAVGTASIVWSIRPGLSIFALEDLEELKMSQGDTVRFVLTSTRSNVLRAEESIIFVDGRRVYIDPATPEIQAVLSENSLAFSDISVLEVEGLRRHNRFPLDARVVKIHILQELVPTPADPYRSNLNYLVEPSLLTFIPDFDGLTPFSVFKASGTTGVTTGSSFTDASATFITSNVFKGDLLRLGGQSFRILSVVSETEVITASILPAGLTDVIWRISHIAPDRLWAEFMDVDNSESIQANFGHLVDLTKSSVESRLNFDYLSAVRGLFKSFFSGPTIESIRVGLELLNGLPVAEEAGTLVEITAPIGARVGRIRIRDSKNPAVVRVYFFPVDLGVADTIDTVTGLPRPLQVGDVVERFQSLSKGVEIRDYINSPEWWKPFTAQGLITEIEKYASFEALVSHEVFDIENLDFMLSFLANIKPTYVKLLFVVTTRLLFAEIEVNDELNATLTRNLRDGIFVPPATLDEPIDGAGDPIFRLDFDTNFPVSTSPNVELAEVSKFDDYFAPNLEPAARLSDIPDFAYRTIRSGATRFGTGTVQPDGITFISAPLSFLGTDVGNTVIINGQVRTITLVVSDTTIQVTPAIAIYTNVPWAITDSSGTVLFSGALNTLTDASAQFINGSGVPLVDEGDFLEISHPSINGGTPTVFHIIRAQSTTVLEFTDLLTLFDTSSGVHAPGTHINASWTVYRGLRYMPKPAFADPDFGTNVALNESLVPPGYLEASYLVEATPTTGGPGGAASGLVNGDRVSGVASALAGASMIAGFIDTTFVTNSAPLPVDGSPAIPIGLPPAKKIVLWDIDATDGLTNSGEPIEVYTTTSTGLNSWTLLQSFNDTSAYQVLRQAGKIELTLASIPPANTVAYKIHTPNGLTQPNGNTVVFAEVELYLSEEFEHLHKNFHLNLGPADDVLISVISAATVTGTLTFTDSVRDFVAMGVVAGDHVGFSSGPNSGLTFAIVTVAPGGDVTKLDLAGSPANDAGPITYYVYHLEGLDSRPADVLSFLRTMPSGSSFSGTGSTFGSNDVFEDDDASRIIFCMYDLGKTIVIGPDSRVIIEVQFETSAARRVKLDSALPGPVAAVAWSITAPVSGILDGDIK